MPFLVDELRQTRTVAHVSQRNYLVMVWLSISLFSPLFSCSLSHSSRVLCLDADTSVLQFRFITLGQPSQINLTMTTRTCDLLDVPMAQIATTVLKANPTEEEGQVQEPHATPH